jgi:hypothetical protein
LSSSSCTSSAPGFEDGGQQLFLVRLRFSTTM